MSGRDYATEKLTLADARAIQWFMLLSTYDPDNAWLDGALRALRRRCPHMPGQRVCTACGSSTPEMEKLRR